MDLFTTIVSESQLHENFKRIYNSPHYRMQRKLLQEWADRFPDRDGKFVKEFQTTFNSSFWELYLHELFCKYGFRVDMTHNTPDFLIDNQNQEIIVEAAIANNPIDGIPEWEKSVYEALNISDHHDRNVDYDFTQFNMESIIRFSNSICEKYKKYKQTYRDIEHVKNKPFVIALSPFHDPKRGLSCDIPIRALLYDYYVDEQEMKSHPEQYPDGRPPTKHLGEVLKKNGASILLGFFNDKCMKEVSAVIFSSLATMGKIDALCENDNVLNDKYLFSGTCIKNSQVNSFVNIKKEHYKESIQDGIQVYHNPYAQYPIEDDFFKADGVIQCMGYINNEQKILGYENYDNCLMTRNVLRLTSNM